MFRSHRPELRRSDAVGVATPLAVQIEITSRCNLRCQMCPLTTGSSSSSGEPGPMGQAVFDGIVDIASRCRQVIVAGYGEPLTARECLPFLEALDRLGVHTSIATNGLSITGEVARRLAAMANLAPIIVSIDSPDPACYRAIRGGNVDRALGGLRNLMTAVDNTDRVAVASVAMSTNLPTLVEFPRLLSELGVGHYLLQGVRDYTDYAVEGRLVGYTQLSGALHQIEANCEHYGIRLELSTPERSAIELREPNAARARFYGPHAWDESRTRRCTVPWEIPYVDKDGRVFPCCIAGAANESQVGDLRCTTFDDVWNGTPLRGFRRDLLSGSTTPPVCRQCTAVELGVHPLRTWSAQLGPGAVDVSHGRCASVTVRVRNTGSNVWARNDPIRIGTVAPRDSHSPLFHDDWLCANRAATFIEDRVEPGSHATFHFPVQVPEDAAVRAEFQVVVDGVMWLPNTQFAVSIGGPATPRARLVLRRVSRHLGRRLRAARGARIPFSSTRV